MEGHRYTSENLEADFALYIDYPNPEESSCQIIGDSTGRNVSPTKPEYQAGPARDYARQAMDPPNFHPWEVNGSEFVSEFVETEVVKSEDARGHIPKPQSPNQKRVEPPNNVGPEPMVISDDDTIQNIEPPAPSIRGHSDQQNPQAVLMSAVGRTQIAQQGTKAPRCSECRFAHTGEVCDGGSPCQRCKRLYEKLSCQLKRNPEQWLPMNAVVLFDIVETQELLVALREEADEIAGLGPGSRLEDIFTGQMLCHFDSAVNPSPYSSSSTPVIIKKLATTRHAAYASAISEEPLVCPALDAVQMDGFIDRHICDIPTGSFLPTDRGIIKAALRCAAYLAILFNWDKNIIYTESSGLFSSKNLALETVYAFAYRIQELIKLLSQEVHRSINHSDTESDPATVSCALWIVYRSFNNCKSLKWNAKSLRNLRIFLNGLHQRAPAALTALQRYKTVVAYTKCGQQTENMRAFVSLINAQTKPKAVMSFAYEKNREMLLSWLATCPNRIGCSYTDILEVKEVVLLFDFSEADVYIEEFHKSADGCT